MTEFKLTREDCILLLQQMHKRLQAVGEHRYPKRSDFLEREVVAIKAFLGPWPRALETAGIKPPREDDRSARNREKRIRAKQRQNAERRALKHALSNSNPVNTESDEFH